MAVVRPMIPQPRMMVDMIDGDEKWKGELDDN